MEFFSECSNFHPKGIFGCFGCNRKDRFGKKNSMVCTHRIANNNWFSGCGTSTTDIIKKLP